MNTLEPIRQQINAGDRQEAQAALVRLLEAEPDNADAWALLAILLTHPAERARCYREILRIDPDNRQAALWLEALTGAQPSVQEPPRASEPSAPVPGDEGQPATPTAQGEDELEHLLDEMSLLGPDDRPEQPSREPMIPKRQAERRGFLDGLLGRRQRETYEPDAEDLLTGPGEMGAAAGALSPDLILKLAGGPLAPEERRNCPQCDAVVSRHEARCPWCSAALGDAEDE